MKEDHNRIKPYTPRYKTLTLPTQSSKDCQAASTELPNTGAEHLRQDKLKTSPHVHNPPCVCLLLAVLMFETVHQVDQLTGMLAVHIRKLVAEVTH